MLISDCSENTYVSSLTSDRLHRYSAFLNAKQCCGTVASFDCRHSRGVFLNWNEETQISTINLLVVVDWISWAARLPYDNNRSPANTFSILLWCWRTVTGRPNARLPLRIACSSWFQNIDIAFSSRKMKCSVFWLECMEVAVRTELSRLSFVEMSSIWFRIPHALVKYCE